MESDSVMYDIRIGSQKHQNSIKDSVRLWLMEYVDRKEKGIEWRTVRLGIRYGA